MTLAAVKKLAFRLPQADRVKLADALLDSLPAHRAPVTLAELERRADEVESGNVKPVSGRQFRAHIARLRKSI
jgi:putative addiction module component (TIGR02574 family)